MSIRTSHQFDRWSLPDFGPRYKHQVVKRCRIDYGVKILTTPIGLPSGFFLFFDNLFLDHCSTDDLRKQLEQCRVVTLSIIY